MLYIAKSGFVLPQNTSELQVHTEKESSEVRLIMKNASPDFKPGDVLYVLSRDGTVTKHSFHRPFTLEEDDAQNGQYRQREQQARLAKFRKPVNEAPFTNRVLNRLSHPTLPWKIVTLGDLVRRSEYDLRSIGLGRISMTEIRDVLTSEGLMLGCLRHIKVAELDLPLRVTNALLANNVTNIEDLLEQTRPQVRFVTQSVKATQEIEDTLAKMGFTFAR